MNKELLALAGKLFVSGKSKNKGAVNNRAVEINSDEYEYQVYAPANARENALPVIVFLHGIRERGRGGYVPVEGAAGALVKHYLGQVPAIVLLPQCRPGKYWSDAEMDKMVIKALEQTLEEFSADKSRVYLIGVSMGGYGVWHFAAQHPKTFAAIVSICGGSPVMTGDRFDAIARKIGKTPAWIFHGADDAIVPVSESRGLFRALEKNQGNVKYDEYAGVGHNVWLNVLTEKNLLPWLFEQRI